MHKRLLAMLLAALMTSSVMTACGNTEDTGAANDPADTTAAETAPAETEKKDDVPEGLKFTGETFTILSREDLIWETEMVAYETDR